jgi:hypothetical protein
VANAIIPTDIGIAVNKNVILFEVYAILNHQNILPTITSVELPIIRALMNAINSMLMASEYIGFSCNSWILVLSS